MSLSVIIVSWEAADDLPGCLSALQAQELGPDELIVVDNASKDGSCDVVARLWPTAQVLRMEENVGFAAAANRGITAARGDFIGLLNYDVRLGADYYARCLQRIRSDPRLGSVQGLLLRPGGRLIDSAGHVATRGRWMRSRGENQVVGSVPLEAEIFGVAAAAGVYRLEMLEDVRAITGHYLEPAFFAYLEDVDLDWRARWRGWKSELVSDTRAEHHHSGSGARPRPAIQRHIVKNRLLLLYRNEAATALVRDLPWIAGQLLARWAAALVWAPSSLLGIVDALRLIPGQATVRRRIRDARRVQPRELRRWFRQPAAAAGGFASRTRTGLPGDGDDPV